MASGPRGKLPTPYRIWISSPEVADKFEQLGLHLLRNGQFTPREVEIAVLVSAVHGKSQFVTAAHIGIAARCGLEQAIVDDLLSGREPALTDERELLVHRLSALLVRHEPVPDDLFDEAARCLGHTALAELTALLGYYAAVQMITGLYAAQPQPPAEGK